MTIYLVILDDGSTFRMDANLVQASAPISANFHSGENGWQDTPYQTADARHNKYQAAKLVNDYFRASDDDSEVESVEAVAAPSHILIRPLGGTMWSVSLVMDDGSSIDAGRIDAGEIDEDGQWQGDMDDLEDEARTRVALDCDTRKFALPDDIDVRQ